MIPIALSAVAPATTVGDLFGPLATIAVFGVLAGLFVLVAVVALQSWAGVPRERHAASTRTAPDAEVRSSSKLRPAA